MSLSSHSTVSWSSLQPAGQAIASWLTPSIRQPSPAITQVRWSTRSSPKRAARWRSAMAMPTAVARPWPSGPVVVSTPGVWPYSGWPGGVGAPLAEVAQLLHRHGLEAGQVQQGVEQHRAVAGRQHEAVAVGPVGLGGVVLQELGQQHRGHVGHAHRHARVAGVGLCDGVHRQDADGVGHRLRRGGHGAGSSSGMRSCGGRRRTLRQRQAFRKRGALALRGALRRAAARSIQTAVDTT